MRHSSLAVHLPPLVLTAALCHAQDSSKPISKEAATHIALTAAGCKKGDDCIAKGHLDHGHWVFVITFVDARDASGKPLIRPGGWMGITLDQAGKVVDKMQGD